MNLIHLVNGLPWYIPKGMPLQGNNDLGAVLLPENLMIRAIFMRCGIL